MALAVKDVTELPSGRRMKLEAGNKGMNRPVVSVEIADYEFAPGISFVSEAEFDLEQDMEAGSFIITSFLFAKDDPELILPAIQKMEEMGMAGLAYKQIIYRELPREVLDFADRKGFPVFSFAKDVWFENIIFDIMYAVQFDDKVYLSEEKIRAMLSGRMSRSELDVILKGISLKLQPFISIACFSGMRAGAPSGQEFDAGRILRSFYLSKGLRDKALMARYENGIFIIATSAAEDLKTHRLILQQAAEISGISNKAAMAVSGVHPAKDLDRAFREGWYCAAAMRAEENMAAVSGEGGAATFDCFEDAGIYRMIVPVIDVPEVESFAAGVLEQISANADLTRTAAAYAASGGDIQSAAESLHCHQNTVRYRLGRIRTLTGLERTSDADLYMHLRLAFAVRCTDRYFSRRL